MSYKQLKTPNVNIAGYGNLCLNYVRRTFGIGSKYAYAWQSWEQSKTKHTGALPNVAVPVYFEYVARIGGIKRNWGHIATYVPNKGLYSTTKYGVRSFSTPQELANYIGGRYVGWSLDVNNVAVAELVATPSPPAPLMPSVGAKIILNGVSRSTFVKGTTKKAGTIKNPNNWAYFVRGRDPIYKYRVLINTKSGGGNGVALALYYTNGKRIEGWK